MVIFPFLFSNSWHFYSLKFADGFNSWVLESRTSRHLPTSLPKFYPDSVKNSISDTRTGMVLGKILRKNLHRHSLLLQGNHQKNRLHQRQRLLPKLDLSMNYSQKVLMDEYNFSFYNHFVLTVDLSARQ